MSYHTLDPQKTALIFFDFLNAYYHGSDELEKAKASVIANAVRLRNAAKETGVAVCYGMADHRADGQDAAMLYSDTNYTLQPWKDPEHEHIGSRRTLASGTWGAQVIEEIAPDEDDYIIKKHRWSPFHATHLALSLQTRAINTVVICGGGVQIGIASTAYSARDLDFNTVFVEDCLTGKQEDLDYFTKRIFPFIGRVRTTEATIAMMRAGAASAR